MSPVVSGRGSLVSLVLGLHSRNPPPSTPRIERMIEERQLGSYTVFTVCQPYTVNLRPGSSANDPAGFDFRVINFTADTVELRFEVEIGAEIELGMCIRVRGIVYLNEIQCETFNQSNSNQGIWVEVVVVYNSGVINILVCAVYDLKYGSRTTEATDF